MYVNVAVLTETRAHERRLALVPSVIPKLVKLGARLHMQPGAGAALHLPDAAFEDVVFIADRTALVKDADVVLAVQPPALEVIDAMREGAILMCFIYADNEPALVKRLQQRKITCFAMERVPRITRAQAMDALSSQSALAGILRHTAGFDALGSGCSQNHQCRRLNRACPGSRDGSGRCGPGGHRDGAPPRRCRRRL